jgi:hypothetical protein
MSVFNPLLCFSVKSKSCLNEQCLNKPKQNETLCGVHLNSKNLLLFTQYNNINVVPNILTNAITNVVNNDEINSTNSITNVVANAVTNAITHTNIINKINSSNVNINKNNNVNENDIDKELFNETYEKNKKISENDEHDKHIDKNNDDKKSIYTKEELFDIIQKNKCISIYSLRKSIKNCYLNKFMNTKQTKQNLIKDIKIYIEKERYHMANQYSVIQIQKVYRGWLLRKRMGCVNDTDILTFDSIYDIPRNAKGCIVKTSVNSGIDIFFGNTNFGAIPENGSEIRVEYMTNQGAEGNINATDKMMEWRFLQDGYDITGEEVDINELVNVSIENPIDFGTNFEPLYLTRLIGPKTSRSFVLANPDNYIIFLEKFNYFGIIDAFTTFDDNYLDDDNVIYLFLARPAFMLANQCASCPLRPPCLAVLRKLLTLALVLIPCLLLSPLSCGLRPSAKFSSISIIFIREIDDRLDNCLTR